MDSRHFDAITRILTEAGTRRGVLGLLATLPILGGLVTPHELEAKKKRKKKRKKKCKPHAKTRTCAGKCGAVKNNCKKTVDCGSCDCTPACGVCQACQGKPGTCVPAPAGTPCGNPGQFCRDDGSCSCTATSCEVCHVCQGNPGTCVPGPTGIECGDPGQFWQVDGTCACIAASCPDFTFCIDGRCWGA